MTVDRALPHTGDVAVDVKQMVTDLEALPLVLQARTKWSDDESDLYVSVVLAQFDWETRKRVIEIIDAVHQSHATNFSIDFDVVDRDHAPFGEFI